MVGEEREGEVRKGREGRWWERKRREVEGM